VKLIIGGEYQGKLDYALRRFGYPPCGVHYCEYADARLRTDKPVIYKLERWVLEALHAGLDPSAEFRALLPELTDKIIICTDMTCGVVPSDPATRAWREASGRAAAAAAEAADEVVRLFCGIPSVLKFDVPRARAR
jgi:hypothetical protein